MPGMPTRPAAAVDTRHDPSLSFAPLDRPIEREQPTAHGSELHPPDRASETRPRRRRPRLLVEAGRPAIVVASLASAGGHLGMSEYPVQLSKVQAPPLREETLARDRLLGWLSVKIHRRAVLLIAEAGYGKTTLLADFSRRTRLRVLWFRLDRGDRDWVGFLAHLVAAVRIHVPDFGPSTSALLRETATAAPLLETVLDTFLRELGTLPNEPTALVFDDFHLVDDAPDAQTILREMLARGPERMSFVVASRRQPTVRLARLRALGEVAELGTDDLRFDPGETERLFRDTYEMRLEPAVLAELSRRTEGWAASLQLVRAAINDRSPAQIRSFISSLSGAEGHLYEYLAEEVVGELPVDLQTFLMRTSILEIVDLVLGPIAAEESVAAARGFIEDGERHGLFGKGGPNTRHVVRAHPLVRDFLQARLARMIGDDGLREIHLRVAQAAESVDWRTAARHYLAAGEEDDARRVLAAAIEKILATGAYAAASEISLSLKSGALEGAPGLVLRSRLAQQRAAAGEGLELAEEAWIEDKLSTAVLLNLVSARTLAGDVAGALDAGRLLEGVAKPELAALSRAYQRALETSIDGSLDVAVTELRQLRDALRDRGEHHFLGVSLCNEAQLRMAIGDAAAALSCADEAISLLRSSSAGVELVSARLVRATALAHLGEIVEARQELDGVIASASPGQRVEIVAEAAEVEEFYGFPPRALDVLASIGDFEVGNSDTGDKIQLARAIAKAHAGDLVGASADLEGISVGRPHSTPAFELRRQLGQCLVQTLGGRPAASVLAAQARTLAVRQGARMWEDYAVLIEAVAMGESAQVVALGIRSPVVLSMAAEALVATLARYTADAVDQIRVEASRRPWRWLAVVRGATTGSTDSRIAAAQLLEEIGETSDVPLLRSIARSIRDPRHVSLGRSLARRLAKRVLVEDLGRVRVQVGERAVEGADVRRKVLGLLCLLLTRPRWTATREEVVDSLWPDLDPQSALNSLNQTVYFLRRVFEPEYREDTSPGYVQQDGETIWLDSDLIDTSSRRCIELIRGGSGDRDPDASVALAREYRGRFALDFAYEEWTSAFRDSLHAAYLRVIETAVRLDVDSGNYLRAVFLAERACEVEPDSEELQLALVKIYRLAGAHAAAAEQYAHYAQNLRDLGVEPPSFADV